MGFTGRAVLIAGVVSVGMLCFTWVSFSPLRACGGGSGLSDVAGPPEDLDVLIAHYERLLRNMSTRVQMAEQLVLRLRGNPRKPSTRGRWRPIGATGVGTNGTESAGGAGANSLPSASGKSEDDSDDDEDDDAAGANSVPIVGAKSENEKDDGEEEKSDSEEAADGRSEAEETKEHLAMIHYDEQNKTFQRFRDDYKCGTGTRPLPDGGEVQCGFGNEPCCSGLGWCGLSIAHCTCETCTDHRGTVALSMFSVDIAFTGVECQSQVPPHFTDAKTPEECASRVLAHLPCKNEGGQFMFSKSYPDWGCRCCDKAGADANKTNPAWVVYKATLKSDGAIR